MNHIRVKSGKKSQKANHKIQIINKKPRRFISGAPAIRCFSG